MCYGGGCGSGGNGTPIVFSTTGSINGGPTTNTSGVGNHQLPASGVLDTATRAAINQIQAAEYSHLNTAPAPTSFVDKHSREQVAAAGTLLDQPSEPNTLQPGETGEEGSNYATEHPAQVAESIGDNLPDSLVGYLPILGGLLIALAAIVVFILWRHRTHH